MFGIFPFYFCEEFDLFIMLWCCVFQWCKCHGTTGNYFLIKVRNTRENETWFCVKQDWVRTQGYIVILGGNYVRETAIVLMVWDYATEVKYCINLEFALRLFTDLYQQMSATVGGDVVLLE